MGRRVRPERIRERRLTAGLSQTQLANAIGVSGPVTVARWEGAGKNHRDPDLDTLINVARVCRTSAAYLLGETDEPLAPEGVGYGGYGEQVPEMPKEEPSLPHEFAALAAQVEQSGHEMADAIVDQKNEFVGQMRIIGEQLKKRDAKQTELLQGLMAVIERNTQAWERASQVMEETMAVVERLEQCLPEGVAELPAERALGPIPEYPVSGLLGDLKNIVSGEATSVERQTGRKPGDSDSSNAESSVG